MVQVPSGGLQNICTYGSESFELILVRKIYFSKKKVNKTASNYYSRE